MSSSETASPVPLLLFLALIIAVAAIALDIISLPWLFGLVPLMLLIAVANNDPWQSQTVAPGAPRAPEAAPSSEPSPPRAVHYINSICVFGSQDAWSEDWSAAIAMDAVGKAIRLRKVVRPEATYVDISVEGRKVCRAPYDHTVQPLIDSQDEVDEHYRVAKDPLPEQLQSTLPPLPEEAKEGIRIEGNVVSTIGDDVPPVNAASIIAMRHRPLRIWVSTKEGVQRIEPDDLEEELAALLRHPGFHSRKSHRFRAIAVQLPTDSTRRLLQTW